MMIIIMAENEISKHKEKKNQINIEDEIINENNFFKLLALLGMKNIQNILNYYPGFKYSKLFQKFLIIFEEYKNNINDSYNINEKLLKTVEKFAKRINTDFPLKKLIENLSLKEKERKLILTYGITNKSVSFFIILLFILKQRIKII